MRVWLKTFNIVLIFGAGFLFGYNAAPRQRAGEEIVAVTLENDAGKSIRELRIIHDHGSAEAKNIAPGEAPVLKFYAPRETSYHLELTFEDGKFMEAGPRQALPGLQVTETIKDEEISYSVENRKK